MKAFFMSLSMFSIIPCKVKNWRDDLYMEMLLYLPAVGLIIGGIWCILTFIIKDFIGEVLLVPENTPYQFLSSAIVAFIPWILSGFMHLDGFMDCADAVLSRRDKEERLRILKDSRVGAFAVITLVILAIMQFAAVGDINFHGKYEMLIFIPAISRCASAFTVLSVKPLKTSSYAATHSKTVPFVYKLIPVILAGILLIVAALFFRANVLALVTEIIAFAVTALVLVSNLGGMSGDVSGSAITISELVALMALVFF